MPKKEDIRWFKETFWNELEAALDGTVFDPDMLVAHPRGQEMFDIARAALLAMAEHVPGYGFAKNRPDKFCHGFGVFQYDLQFFKSDPDYFLERRYERFEETLGRALRELTSALKKRDLDHKPSISDFEFCTVAITYNTGGFKPNKGLKQGHFDGSKYYGEHINDYLAIARGIPAPGEVEAQPAEPLVLSATGPFFRVETLTTSLRLRSEPEISSPLTRNVIAEMPDGWPVRAFTGEAVNGFIEIETVIDGTVFRGFSSLDYLVPVDAAPEVVVSASLAASKEKAIPAVWMPRKQGTITKRTENANAHSLNEANMPGRSSGTPDELRAELATIITYLDPAKGAHKRYRPHSGLTFCNIYAHDFCALAGVYLPRVWWTDKALLKIAAGDQPKPLYGDTIREMRANDLFRWLRDYGGPHGWLRATSSTELQNRANLGAVCLIIARRKQEGRSGHVAMVVPETATWTAKRMPGGEVSSPLQSQAGSKNFNYGTGTSGWWTASRFAEFAMWYHP
ncbi:MAG: hypothetical protein C0606_07560 [Hyphomicrobiales bacterium]|nr:MAG: hypothetical protein C0606_07560 [Hyphomicrobiales bacterium]